MASDELIAEAETNHLSLDKRPQGSGRKSTAPTVGDHIRARDFLERYDALGLVPVLR